jgi:hypothetical protein
MQKRVMVATMFGLIFGVVCLLLGHYAGKTPWSAAFVLSGLANRGMMGFVIGVTALRINPYARGALFGLLMSLGPGLAFWTPDKTVPYLLAGTIYGFLTDVLTTKVFKADVGVAEKEAGLKRAA